MNAADFPYYLTGTAGTVLAVFLLILAALWFLLPFAVFAIHRHAERHTQQNDRIIELLEKLTDRPREPALRPASGQEGAGAPTAPADIGR